MIVEKVVVGSLEENCYIISKNNECIIIDPGDETNKIIKKIDNKKVVGILITHNHFDHIGSLKELMSYFHIIEINNKIANFNYKIINTPGHTKDSLSFYFKEEKIMFVGDFIFYHSIGRMDLPTGSIKDMINSLEKISTYPADTILYPGHGHDTILGEEKKRFSSYFY